MGGYSSEAAISQMSGNTVCKNLDPQKYTVYPVSILTEGWFCNHPDHKPIPVDKSDFSITIEGTKINFDCVFNTIHGTPGEDGLIQGYLQHIPSIPQNYSPPYWLSQNMAGLLSQQFPQG